MALAASGYYYQKINCSKKVISEKWCCSVGNAWSVFLYNVVWGLLGITQGFYLCDVVPRVLRRHWTEFFHVKCCLEAYWTIFITRGFYLWLYNVAPREFKTPRTRINSCAMSSRTSRTTHYIGFFFCNVAPGVLRKHCHRTFSGSMLSGASWLEQHCTRFLPLQCCPKGIKITLNKMFSFALLSGASRTTLHWVFTSAMFAHG